jgi:hypothetical protein
MPIGTRRRCLIKKTGYEKSRDTVPLSDLLGKKRWMVFSFLEVQLKKKYKCGLECLSFNAHIIEKAFAC